jgi:hypothetical protein
MKDFLEVLRRQLPNYRRIGIPPVVLVAMIAGAAAQQTPAAFIFPQNGQQNVTAGQPFQWTSDPNALAYYLYVGTTQGAKDVVNSGETLATSWPVQSLPAGASLWGRIYTKYTDNWVYQDINFATAPSATLISPLNGQTNLSVIPTFQWTSASGAQGYDLSLGTTQGADNVLNTGAMQGTTYTVTTPLPAGAVLWARLWTELNGSWVYQADISFTVSLDAALVSPRNGQQNVNPGTTFQWTASAGAAAYYLYVGTTQGAKDIVNTGAIQGTSYTVTTPLPAGANLWARIYTQLGNHWVYASDVNFTVSPEAALLYPVNGQQNVDTSVRFTWAPGVNVQAYRLYVGTEPGAKDLVDTGQIRATSWHVPPLPVGQTLYARIWTKINGFWMYPNDVSFTAELRFGYPAVQSVDIDPTVAFSWSAASGGSGVSHLSIGSSPGGNDLYDNTAIQSNSFTLPLSALPAGSVLYARIRETPADGLERRTDTVFTVAGTAVAPATMVYPVNGATNTDLSQPFQWTATDLAQAYRLEVSNGSSLVLDTGSITVPRYFDETLGLGSYTGRLGTKIGGRWYWKRFTFVVINTGPSMANETNSALWATDYVRNMADAQNYPYAWTELQGETLAVHRVQAVCTEYRKTLLGVLSQINVAGRLPAAQQPQLMDIAFMVNKYDTHTLVEFWNTDFERWMLLDPTFDMTMTRASDGTWASAEDMNAATLNQQWSAIHYQYLGGWGDSLATAYYLDYPLLYLNLQPLPQPGQGQDPMPYLIRQSGPPLSQTGIYVLQCYGTTTVVIDGVTSQPNCNGIDSLSQVMGASTIQMPLGSTAILNIYSPVRNVF